MRMHDKTSNWFDTGKTTVYATVTGKRGNVEIINSPQAGIEPGAS